MKISEAKKMIKRIMVDNDVTGWKVFFTDDEISAGVTFPYQKVIEYCKPFFIHNGIEACRDTVLHELAHALAPLDRQHGEVWKEKCVEIGAIPEQYLSYDNYPRLRMPRESTKIEDITEKFRLPSYPKTKSEIIWGRGWKEKPPLRPSYKFVRADVSVTPDTGEEK